MKRRNKQQRIERLKRYHMLYKVFHSYRTCYYCGDVAGHVDHVPALAVVDRCGLENIRKANIDLLLVNSCPDCNMMLGAKPLMTLNSRVKHLYKTIQKRYEKQIEMESWSEEELEELEGTLKQYVSSSNDIKLYIEHRLLYMEDLFYDIL